MKAAVCPLPAPPPGPPHWPRGSHPPRPDAGRHGPQGRVLVLGGGERHAPRGRPGAAAEIGHEAGTSGCPTEAAPAALRWSASTSAIKARMSSMSKSQPLSGSGKCHVGTHSTRRRPKPSRSVSPALPAPEIRIGTSGWHYDPGTDLSTRRVEDQGFPVLLRPALRHGRDQQLLLPPPHRASRAGPGTIRRRNGFLFAWKASRFITHMKRLKGIEESIELVFGRMNALGDKFGPVLFQLPPTFKADDETRERLARCLSLLPQERRCAFEFRHPSWYEEAVFRILRDHNAALCISDHADAPAPWETTADFVYIRAHGTNGRYAGSYGADTLQGWAGRIARMAGGRAQCLCLFRQRHQKCRSRRRANLTEASERWISR